MQRLDPKRNLCAIELVRRATTQAGNLQQPGYYGIQGQRPDQPWVRQGCPSSFSEIDRQDECLNVWAGATGHYVEFPEIRLLAEMADLEFQGNEHNVLAFGHLGFQPIPAEPTSYLNFQTEVEIYDAKPDNVIFDKQGNMLPFDVWINDPDDTFGLRSAGLNADS